METATAHPQASANEIARRGLRAAVWLAAPGLVLSLAGVGVTAAAYAGRTEGNVRMAVIGVGALLIGLGLLAAGTITAVVSYVNRARRRRGDLLARQYSDRNPGGEIPLPGASLPEAPAAPRTKLAAVPFAAKNKGVTTREFRAGADVWRILEDWALRAGYSFVGQDTDSRTYKKGNDPVFVPTFVRLTWKDPDYVLETWLEPTAANRFVSLGMIPRVLGPESGGVMGSIPRYMARGDINQLMVRLGVPPIA
jgi:hypothetical protein